MASREQAQTPPDGRLHAAGRPLEDVFLRALAAALSPPPVPGERIAEERAEYEPSPGRGVPWPPRGLPPLLREAREALDRAGPSWEGMGSDAAAEALNRLARLAGTRLAQAASVARRLYAADPAALGEDVFLCRCLARAPDSALEMAAMRHYLQAASVPAAEADLSLDRTVCGEQVSFAFLWAEPHRFEGVRATFDRFRGRYVAAYRQQHESYRRALSRLAIDLEEAQGKVQALARLNALEGLGRALGREALAALTDLQEVRPCPRDEPLPDPFSPACACGFALGHELRREWIDEAIRRVERALGQQMARLSRQAVRRILARPFRRKDDERLERFLQVVQASDVGGLVNVLDDQILAFLREVLTPPAQVPAFLREEPAPPVEGVRAPVLEQLMRSFPVIGEDQVDEATAAFRRLLLEALDQARRSSPERAPVVRLAPSAPTRRRREDATPS